MDTAKSLLERLRAKYDGCSDYRLAKILGIGKTSVSRYMAHDGGMSTTVGRRLAEELGISELYVAACLALQREQTDQDKEVWHAIMAVLQKHGVTAMPPPVLARGKTAPAPARARRASKVAAVLLSAGIAGLSSMVPRQAHAEVVRSDCAPTVYYGKRRGGGRWGAFRNCDFPPILPRRKRRPRRRDFLAPAALPILAT